MITMFCISCLVSIFIIAYNYKKDEEINRYSVIKGIVCGVVVFFIFLILSTTVLKTNDKETTKTNTTKIITTTTITTSYITNNYQEIVDIKKDDFISDMYKLSEDLFTYIKDEETKTTAIQAASEINSSKFTSTSSPQEKFEYIVEINGEKYKVKYTKDQNGERYFKVLLYVKSAKKYIQIYEGTEFDENAILKFAEKYY